MNFASDAPKERPSQPLGAMSAKKRFFERLYVNVTLSNQLRQVFLEWRERPKACIIDV